MEILAMFVHNDLAHYANIQTVWLQTLRFRLVISPVKASKRKGKKHLKRPCDDL